MDYLFLFDLTDTKKPHNIFCYEAVVYLMKHKLQTCASKVFFSKNCGANFSYAITSDESNALW